MAKSNAQSVQDETDIGSATDEGMDSVLEYSESVEEQERPEPLPVGTYNATVTSAKVHTSSASGNKSLALTVEIGSDDMPADYVSKYQYDKKTFTKYLGVVKDDPSSRYNLKQLCVQLRLPIPTRSFDINTCVGSSVKVEIKHGKDLENLPREEVGRFMKS